MILSAARKVQGDGEEVNLEKEFRKKYESPGQFRKKYESPGQFRKKYESPGQYRKKY